MKRWIPVILALIVPVVMAAALIGDLYIWVNIGLDGVIRPP